MRKLLAVSVSVVLVGCGVFGASDGEKQADPLPPPSTPQDNAQPPPPVGAQAPEGIFVTSSKGSDTGSGTATNPLKTFAKAFALAKERGLRVIACAETFDEALTLLDGVSAYGYYDCSAAVWTRIERHAVVQPKASPAAVARALTLPTRIEGFDILAPDVDDAPATRQTGTSIALLVQGTKNLVLSEVLLHGGKGAPGSDGQPAPGNAHVSGAAKGGNGVDRSAASCNPSISNCDARKVVGPAGGIGTCSVGGGGPGGAGGDGTWYNRLTGAVANPATWNGKPLAPAPAVTALGGSTGLGGATGAAGPDGADGTVGKWSFDNEGFVVGDGTAGTSGSPGQGGGGGGGSQYYYATAASPNEPENPYHQSSTGGGGGAGGCAGLAAQPGTGGGASIGALVLLSDVRFERTRIEASTGGRAGRGFIGGFGTVGASGGTAAILSGKGGDGGSGGSAGFSGHGAPGPSIALAFSGTRPAIDAAALVAGPAGAGWPEEQKNDGARVKVLPAVTGQSLAEYAIVR